MFTEELKHMPAYCKYEIGPKFACNGITEYFIASLYSSENIKCAFHGAHAAFVNKKNGTAQSY